MTKATQTIDQAIAAIEDAGNKRYGRDEAKFYDPRKRGAYIVLDDGYSNADFGSYPEIQTGDGKPSGAFCSEIREILESQRKQILEQGK